MSRLDSFFLSNSFVRKVLNWKQADEEIIWRDKAVETLKKKLKRLPNEQYKTMELALERKSEDSPCVVLPRSQDGRLQVSHRKMLPHVMYCRIYRWPDLQSQHELKSTSTCLWPFTRRDSTRICVNPYHYTRVDHSLYPPVVTPRGPTEFANASPPPQSPLSPGSVYSQHQQSSPTNYFASNHGSVPMNGVGMPQSPQQLPPSHNQNAFLHPSMDNPSTNYIDGSHNPHATSHSYFTGAQSPMSESNWHSGNVGIGPNGEHVSLAESPRPYHFDGQTPPPVYLNREQHLALMPMETDHESRQTNNTFNGSDEGQDHWCRITYAELNQKIGEPFKGSSREVIVDGFTDPSVHNRRFSLGVLSNINRNSVIEMTRRAIRKGVCLENNDAQIYVRNLSESSIFFHSKNCNVENQLSPHAVVKIEPHGRQKIFDQKVFEHLVQEAVRSQEGKSYERLYSLTEHCIIKMSFVKGWGSIYQRQDVTSTPCWIEIHLLKPYALIDQYLQQVGPPESRITSTS